MNMSLVECINSVLKWAHNLPITALVRTAYFLLAELFARKDMVAYAQRAAENIFSEVVMTQLRENQEASRNMCIISFARRYESFYVQQLGQDFKLI